MCYDGVVLFVVSQVSMFQAAYIGIINQLKSLFYLAVRLCDNKLDLIRQVLDSSSTAYKKYDKVDGFWLYDC